MSAKTDLVSLRKDIAPRPGLAVCYASGSVFRIEGRFHRVETGKRRLVSRALCVVGFYKKRCEACPNSKFKATFKARGEPDEP